MRKQGFFILFFCFVVLGNAQDYVFRENINQMAYLSISESPKENEKNLINAYQWVAITKNTALQRDVSRCFAQYHVSNRNYLVGDSILAITLHHCRTVSDSLGMYYCLLIKGVSLIRQDNDAGISLLYKTLQWGYRNENEVVVVRSSNSLSNALLWSGQFEEAKKIQRKSIRFCRTKNDSLMLSSSLRSYAYVLRNSGEMDSVPVLLGEAIRIDKALHRFNDFDRNLTNLASVMIEQRYYNEAIEMLHAALFFSKRFHHDNLFYYVHSNLASAYLHIDQLEKAYFFANCALAEARGNLDDFGVANTYFIMGEIYYKRNNKEKSFEYYKRAEELFTAIEETRSLLLIYDRLGTLHMDNHSYHEAIQMFEKGKKMADQQHDRISLKDLNSGLAYAYEYIGEYKNAYQCLRVEKNISDSIFNLELIEKISSLDSNFELEKKQYVIRYLDKENRLINQKLKVSQWLFILIVLLVFVAILASYFIYKNVRTKHRLEVTERNMKALRSQMNPHFFFNVLNGIQAQIYKGEKTEAARYLQKTALLMRDILDSSVDDYISLDSEIRMMENYLLLQKMRMGEIFDYEIDVRCEMESDWVLIPSMLAQPFVENALKHAFVRLDTHGKLYLRYSIEGSSFEIEIKDNGRGFSEKSESTHVSRSMSITRERLLMYEKKTRRPHRLVVQSSSDGVIVLITGLVKTD